MASPMTAEQLRAELERIASWVRGEVHYSFGRRPSTDHDKELHQVAKALQNLAARLSGMAAACWISVEDRLPTEKREFQIYYAQYRTQAISEFLPEEDPPSFWHGDPTHWRELPEPPHD